MLEEVKIMLGDSASNYSDDLIGLVLKDTLGEIEAYCNRPVDYELEIVAKRIAIIKLNRINTEGLASQSYSGISESYIDGYPADVMAVLNRKRKIKVI
jgi:hypothetical protein